MRCPSPSRSSRICNGTSGYSTENRRRDSPGGLLTFTLGSPLAHADVLLAKDSETFELGRHQREFPTCPPQQEDDRDRELLECVYYRGNQEVEVRILHHGAPFAVTRWTNLYFPG